MQSKEVVTDQNEVMMFSKPFDEKEEKMPPELQNDDQEEAEDYDDEEEDEQAYPINNNQNFRARPYSSKPTF